MPTEPAPIPNLPWWRQLEPYHWFVFAMASLSWMFDCLDQQIFLLARRGALTALLPPQTSEVTVNLYAGYATSIFMVGWATGGLIFGAVGDRYGRARTLAITVLLYSVSTGLSAGSVGFVDFAVYRFVTGLGVGGVFGLAVALVADSLPAAARPAALGTLQAMSAVGNSMAGLASMWIAYLGRAGWITPTDGWKYLFLLGAIPACLCVLIQWRLKEPAKWQEARAAGRSLGLPFGSYRSLFGHPRWRRNALLGTLLCIAGVVGLWGIGFFAPELVGSVIGNTLRQAGVANDQIVASQANWVGVNSIVQNVGGFIGMISFTWFAQRFGRKPAFVLAFPAAMAATIFYFQSFNGIRDIWMSAILGACQLTLFAGFAIYLPELFPLRLRSTGTSFCYNVGRFIAASGPLTFGALQKILVPANADATAKLAAFRDAASWMSCIFLLGLIAICFLPETHGHPLPEDD